MPRTTDTVSKLKLFEADHDLAVKIQNAAQPVFRQLTLQEIIREAIHLGMPLVQKRYEAAVEAVKKATK
jgi:hypothetical protein